MDLRYFTGIGVFGTAYRVMLENDSHAPGSVDRVLPTRMVRLTEETATYLYSSFTSLNVLYQQDTQPNLERHLEASFDVSTESEERLDAIVNLTSGLARKGTSKLSFGGTEEEVIERGSEWCTDIARVACVLCQVAGIPARIAYLYDLSQAYCGHAIVEAYRRGKWGAADANTGIVYLGHSGEPASVWELMSDLALIEVHKSNPKAYYSTPAQFSGAALTNYSCWESHTYDYSVSGLNDYYASILDMSSKGWPGGLRWLNEEDRACVP